MNSNDDKKTGVMVFQYTTINQIGVSNILDKRMTMMMMKRLMMMTTKMMMKRTMMTMMMKRSMMAMKRLTRQ